MSSLLNRRIVKRIRKDLVVARSRRAQLEELYLVHGVRFADVVGLRFIDLFAGFGGFSEGGEQANATCVWAGNHWARAVEAHALNHPLAIHVQQDMHQADWHEVPRGVDIVLAGPSCVPADALIETPTGLQRVDSLSLGSPVLTHLGRPRPITNIWSKTYTGEMISLRVRGDTQQPVTVTADHLVWIRREIGEPRFVQAGDLQIDDYVGFPHVRPQAEVTESHVWRSIHAITREHVVDVTVYDFEVEEDHTFCLPGVVVHNCQGHSTAGKSRAGEAAQIQHETDRSTALAVVNCLEVVRPNWSVTENVPAWLDWPLFDLWRAMLHRLGYVTEVLRLRADHYGSPQARERVFVVGTQLGQAALDHVVAGIRSRVVPVAERKTVASFARWDEGTWKPSERAGAKGSRQRIEAGLALGVDRWWCQHVSHHKGKRIDTPLSTLTGADQHVLCRRLPEDRVEYRNLLPVELLAVQSFPATYRLPPGINRRDLCRGIGNAVDVSVARTIMTAIGEAQSAT